MEMFPPINPESAEKIGLPAEVIVPLPQAKRFRTDWQGLEIKQFEPPDTLIKVWEVDPHPQGIGNVLWCRSYQEMLDLIDENLEYLLENPTAGELMEHGVTIKFQLKEMPKRDYEEIVDDRTGSHRKAVNPNEARSSTGATT